MFMNDPKGREAQVAAQRKKNAAQRATMYSLTRSVLTNFYIDLKRFCCSLSPAFTSACVWNNESDNEAKFVFPHQESATDLKRNFGKRAQLV